MEDNTSKNNFIWWQGVVEDVNDPLKIGRCRVRIIGFHSDNKNDIPTEHLPWANVIQPINSASVSGVGISPTGLVPGSWVFGFFRDGLIAQQPIIFGSVAGISSEVAMPHKGFNDPSGIFPREEYLHESDVNRLARNENIDSTIVKTKNDTTQSGIVTSLGESKWEEPKTPYDSVYPKNKVLETESGHIQEFDDTPGKERIHTYHKAGTFEEIHPDGSKVTRIVKDNYEIVLGDSNILIKGTQAVNVEKDGNYKVQENLNIQIQGNVKIYCAQDVTVETKGNFQHKVSGNYTVVCDKNMVLLAQRIDLNPNGYNSSDIEDPVSPTIKTYN